MPLRAGRHALERRATLAAVPNDPLETAAETVGAPRGLFPNSSFLAVRAV